MTPFHRHTPRRRLAVVAAAFCLGALLIAAHRAAAPWVVGRAVLLGEIQAARARTIEAEAEAAAQRQLVDWYADRWMATLPGLEACREVER